MPLWEQLTPKNHCHYGGRQQAQDTKKYNNEPLYLCTPVSWWATVAIGSSRSKFLLVKLHILVVGLIDSFNSLHFLRFDAFCQPASHITIFWKISFQKPSILHMFSLLIICCGWLWSILAENRQFVVGLRGQQSIIVGVQKACVPVHTYTFRYLCRAVHLKMYMYHSTNVTKCCT